MHKILERYLFRFVTLETLMGSKDKEKKRQRVSSSGAEIVNEDQDGDFIKMTVKQYQDMLGKLTAIEDQAKARDARSIA